MPWMTGESSVLVEQSLVGSWVRAGTRKTKP